jgi:hypothetical protein
MVTKRGLIFVFLLMIIPVVADSDEITTTTIPDLDLVTGLNGDVLDLDDYFDGTNLYYKFKDGGLGLEGITVEINDQGEVDITADNPGDFAVIFIADNDTDVKDSNVVDLTVTGDIIIATTYDFSPSGSATTMSLGEKKTFTVSGENVTAEWYLDNLKLPETSGSFEYDAAFEGVKELKVFIGDQSNTWTITVELGVVVEDIPEEVPVVVQSTAICGDGKKERGENCQNCPEDVSCIRGSACKNGICVKDKGLSGTILWFGLLGVLLVVLVGGIVFAKKKGYLDNIDFLTGILSKFKKKEKVEEKKEVKEEKPSPKVEEKPKRDLSNLKSYIFDNLKKGFKRRSLVNSALQQGWSKEDIDSVLSVGERLKPLETYIKENLKKGFKKEDLAKAALGQGWKQEEIDEVLEKI